MKNKYMDKNFFEVEISNLKADLDSVKFAKTTDKFGDLELQFNLDEKEKKIKEEIKNYEKKNKILNKKAKEYIKKYKKQTKQDLIADMVLIEDKFLSMLNYYLEMKNLYEVINTPLLLWFISKARNWSKDYIEKFCDILKINKDLIINAIDTNNKQYKEIIDRISIELAKLDELEKDPEYKVGYGKPPKHTQFKKGKNSGGNKKGRKPIKGQDISKLSIKKLDKKINIKTKDGKTTKRYYRDVIADNIINSLAMGKPIPKNNMKMIDKLERKENFWKTWKK